MAKYLLESSLGVDGFVLSGVDSVAEGVAVNTYQIGSVQIVWKSATSSDVFTSKGTFDIQISNDAINWNTLKDTNNADVNVEIGSANGNVHVRLITIDFKWIRLKWVKNNSTGGTAKCFAVFKTQGI